MIIVFVIITDELPKEKVKELKKYSGKLISSEKFNKRYRVLLEMGGNSLSYERYSDNAHTKYKFKIGELLFTQSNYFKHKINFINYIDLKSFDRNHLNQKMDSLEEKIIFLFESRKAQKTHLNPEYYIYSTKTGKIDRKGLDFLKDIKGLDSTYSDFGIIIHKGEFFKNFKRINNKA